MGASSCIDQRTRWGVEYRPPKVKTWTLLGTVGSAAEAQRWLLRFAASGDFRVRRPLA